MCGRVLRTGASPAGRVDKTVDNAGALPPALPTLSRLSPTSSTGPTIGPEKPDNPCATKPDRSICCQHPRVRGNPHRATITGMDAAIIAPIIGTVIAVGLALAGLMLRTAARQDRRMDRFEDAMATHRADMRRLAERQSHVEGRLDERGAAAD